MNAAQIDEIYCFLIKNVRFTCVCAFFVVPLQPISILADCATFGTLKTFKTFLTQNNYD